MGCTDGGSLNASFLGVRLESYARLDSPGLPCFCYFHQIKCVEISVCWCNILENIVIARDCSNLVLSV